MKWEKFKVFLLFLTISFILVPNIFSKEPFTLDALYGLKSIGSLSISPDSKYLAFTVTEYFYKKGKSNTDIYLLDLETKKVKRLTYNEKADYNPVWGSDDILYFLSTRDGSPQIYQININGGEAKKLTDFYPFVSSIKYNNGKIYFISEVYPECMAEQKCNRELDKKLKNGPVQAHYAKKLLYRHWTSWRDWKYNHIFVFDIETKKIENITSGKLDYPSFSLGGLYSEFSISPDGKTIAIKIKDVPNPESSTNDDIVVVDLKTKKVRNITKENKAYDGEPVFSPYRNYIAYVMQKIPGYESDRFRIALYNLKNGKRKIITESIDNWATSPVWSPDEKYIYFKVHEKGHYPIYRYSLKKKKIEKILDHSSIYSYLIAYIKGKTNLIYTRTSVGEPVEIYTFKAKSKKPERVTFFNRKIEELYDIRPAEEHWVRSKNGRKIHLFIVKPHNFNPQKKYPLILNIHGGPQQMWADSFRGDWQVYPGAGYVVAFANPTGSPGYGQKFVEAISKDYGGRVMEDIMSVAEYLEKLPYVDSKRMGAMGWSWGGYAIMWLEGHTTKFKALASMMGVYDLESMYGATEELWFPEWDNGGAPWENEKYYKWASPSSYVKNFKTPCLVITGEKDYRVPYTQSLQFFTALQKMNVPSELIVFVNDGHWPSYVKSMPVYYNAHLEWFSKWLGGKPAPYKTEDMIRNIAYEDEKKEESK